MSFGKKNMSCSRENGSGETMNGLDFFLFFFFACEASLGLSL